MGISSGNSTSVHAFSVIVFPFETIRTLRNSGFLHERRHFADIEQVRVLGRYLIRARPIEANASFVVDHDVIPIVVEL
jgi:hypothetical protein